MDEEYLEAVLDVVGLVPPGRVMTYGTVAEVVADALAAAGARPRGGARQVGTVLSRAGSGVPWWRVVTAAGRLPPGHEVRALTHLHAEGTPLTADGQRVAVRRALWWPDDDAVDPAVPPGPGGPPGPRGPGGS